jgi:hypothetical protein
MEKFMLGDYQKMQEITNYLKNNVDDNEYISFSVREYWLILYWTQDFDELLKNIEQNVYPVGEQNNGEGNNQIVPVLDELYQKLLEKSFESKYLLEIMINNSQINDEEKDFLKLHLNYCLFDINNMAITQDSLNMQSDRFIFKYPTSVYNSFIKKNIRYKEKVSDFGFGYDFFLGYGTFSGGISKNLRDYAPFGFSIDLTYKNFDINLGTGLGVAKLQHPVVYQNVTWNKDLKADIFYPYASFGYNFITKGKLSFSPFVGLYSLIIMPNYQDIQYNSALENISFQSDASFLAGLCINYYSKSFNATNRYRRGTQFQAFMKLKYTYFQSGFHSDLDGFNSNMHTICLSFGGFMKRVYRM